MEADRFSGPTFGDLSVEDQRQIDAVCLAFEDAWKLGERPSIREYDARLEGETLRSAGIRELLKIDLEFRRDRGEALNPQSYLELYPEYGRFLSTEWFALSTSPDQTRPYVGRHPSHIDQDSIQSAPSTLGEYELLGEIARGGMGVVYKAWDSKLHRHAAIKLIRSGDQADGEEIRRFYAEAAAAAGLTHPHIVTVYEVGRHGQQPFIAMRYVEGQSLSSRIKESPLEPQEAARLMISVCEAIQFAHDRGIVHRDLKPQNILLGSDGQPLVTDFGLAKRQASDSNLTATGLVLGTPSYMPPEQAAGCHDQVGPQSDIYSLGATLYELLAGRPPFQAANVASTLQQVLEAEPVSPRALNPAVPLDLETICLKCLNKEPPQRYESAQALADDLRRFVNHEPIHARPVPFWERASKWCARHPWLAGLSALAAILVVAVGIASGLAYAFSGAAEVLKKDNDGLAEKERIARLNLELDTIHQIADSAFDEVQRGRPEIAINRFAKLLERVEQTRKPAQTPQDLPAEQAQRFDEWDRVVREQISALAMQLPEPALGATSATPSSETSVASSDQRSINPSVTPSGPHDGTYAPNAENMVLYDAASGKVDFVIHVTKALKSHYGPQVFVYISAQASIRRDRDEALIRANVATEKFGPDGKLISRTGPVTITRFKISTDTMLGKPIEVPEKCSLLDADFASEEGSLVMCLRPSQGDTDYFQRFDFASGKPVGEPVNLPKQDKTYRPLLAPIIQRVDTKAGIVLLWNAGASASFWNLPAMKQLGSPVVGPGKVTGIIHLAQERCGVLFERPAKVPFFDIHTGLPTGPDLTEEAERIYLSPSKAMIGLQSQRRFSLWTFPKGEDLGAIDVPEGIGLQPHFSSDEQAIVFGAQSSLPATATHLIWQWTQKTASPIRVSSPLGSSWRDFNVKSLELREAGPISWRLPVANGAGSAVGEPGHQPFSISVSGNNERAVYSYSDTKTIAVVDLVSGKTIAALTDESPFWNATNHDGTRVMALHRREKFTFWDVAKSRQLGVYSAPKGSIHYAFALSPAGDIAAILDNNGILRLIDANTGSQLGSDLNLAFDNGRSPDFVNNRWLRFSGDGRKLICGGRSLNVLNVAERTWERRWTGEELRGNQGYLDSASVSRDGSTIAASTAENSSTLWLLGLPPAGRGDSKMALQSMASCLHLAPDGRFVATGNGPFSLAEGNPRVQIRNTSTGGLFHEIPLSGAQTVTAIQLSNDGEWLAFGCADGTVSLWDLKTKRQLGQSSKASQAVVLLRFTPDRTGLIVGTTDLLGGNFVRSLSRLPLPTTLTGSAERIKCWVASFTNLKSDQAGYFAIATPDEWPARSAELSKLGGPPPEWIRLSESHRKLQFAQANRPVPRPATAPVAPVPAAGVEPESSAPADNSEARIAREIATQALALGARVKVDQAGTILDISKTGQLPPQRFRVVAIYELRNATDENAAFLARAKTLKMLGIGYSQLTDRGVTWLAEFKQLESLTIWRTRLTAQALAPLSGSQILKSVAADGCPFGNAGLKILGSCPNIEQLTLVDMSIDDEGLQHLRGCTKLQGLLLAGNPITDQSAATLGSLKNLKTLNLLRTKVGIPTMQALAALNIEQLTLGGDKLDPASLAPLAECRALTRLEISSLTASPALFAEIAKLPTVQSVNLVRVTLQDPDLALLAPMKHLKTLGLGGCTVTDACVDELLKIKSLTTVGLSNCPVSPPAIQRLIDSGIRVTR